MAISRRPMRRASLVQTWGVGAIVPFPNDESLMIAGLDAWRYKNSDPMVIRDERLVTRLGVKELRWPPDYRDQNVDPENYGLVIPAVRFPLWHYCPWCGFMKKASPYGQQPTCECPHWETGRNCDPKSRYRRKMVPERFIVICRNGHIDDFPVAEWLHSDEEYLYKPETCVIRRSTGGTSAALTGVFYECTCGAKKSLAGATRSGVLKKKLNYKCSCNRPWLGDKDPRGCDCEEDEDMQVVLRGATNVWFGDTRSSIRIPSESTVADHRIAGIVDENYDFVASQLTNGEFNRQVIDFLAMKNNVDSEMLYKAFIRHRDHLGNTEKVSEDMSEDDYRKAEYNILCKSSGSDEQDFFSINHPISEYAKEIQEYFASISLVPKLKETCAFIGFSRIAPKSGSIAEKKSMLRLGKENWLPAIQVSGEGIFFEFSEKKLGEWARRPEVVERINKLNRSFKKARFGESTPGDLHPEYVLIHTFSHLIINQLSFDCGYGSSSIRERIYCERTGENRLMHGVLIYTASGDSEGSMGGLVRQGKAGHLEDTIMNALHNAMWCASDPVCIQSLGQGPESLNLAACHNCALLPETCCEVGNRLLDRACGVILQGSTLCFLSLPSQI